MEKQPEVACPHCGGREGETVFLWGRTPYPQKEALFYKCVYCKKIFKVWQRAA